MDLIRPNISLPATITAFTTTRSGGVSCGHYEGLNLAEHVFDDPRAVAENRRRLINSCKLPSRPIWINQVHGTTIIDASRIRSAGLIDADGAYVGEPDIVLAILSADCLPLVIYDDRGREVAVVHGGWKGLFHGIVEAAVARFRTPRTRLFAWIGPGISQDAYVVDNQFRERFLDRDSFFEDSFSPDGEKWRADLYKIGERLLNQSGVMNVSKHGGCTFKDIRRFYSYRRHASTGRMATIAWLS